MRCPSYTSFAQMYPLRSRGVRRAAHPASVMRKSSAAIFNKPGATLNTLGLSSSAPKSFNVFGMTNAWSGFASKRLREQFDINRHEAKHAKVLKRIIHVFMILKI